MKAIIIGLIVLGIVIGSAVFYFWYMMKKPLYISGMIREGINLRSPLTPPAQSADGDFWQVEKDIKLYHYSVGKGKNIIIIHGGPGSPFIEPWKDLDQLTDDYRLCYYDQRGCGKSTRPVNRFESSNYYKNVNILDQTLGLGAQIADIERIRQILGDEKIIILGHSWGGFLASLYAAEFPEHISAMILLAPADVLVMNSDEGGGLYDEVRNKLPGKRRPEFDKFLERYFDYSNIFSMTEAELITMNLEFNDFYLAGITDTDVKLQENNKKATGGWMVHAMYFSMGKAHDYRDVMKNVTAPVLVVHNGDDMQPGGRTKIYAEAFPNSRLEVIEGASHFSYKQKTDKLAALLKQFLRDNI